MVRVAACLVGVSLSCHAQGLIRTLAGTDWTFTGDGRPAVEAPLGSVIGVAADASGAVYFSDPDNHLILKRDSDGILSVVAGNGIQGFSGDGGPARNASLSSPLGVAVDSEGSLYFVDSANWRVRKVSADGVIRTMAGNGRRGFSGDGGLATSASIGGSHGVAIAADGTLYVTDLDAHRIRRVAPDGTISTFAGTGSAGFSGDDGPARQAAFRGPAGLAIDAAGNLLVADSGNNRIRQISTEGIITTVAGNGTRAFSGDGGPATAASLNSPYGVTTAASGAILISDTNNRRVRQVAPGGVITTIAGGGPPGRFDDGQALDVDVLFPIGLAAGSDESVYFAETENNRIRRVSHDGTITTAAGSGQFRAFASGSQAAAAFLFRPQGISVDSAGRVFIADRRSHRIRLLDTNGTIRNIAGTGVSAAGGNGPAPSLTISISSPTDITLDSRAAVHFTDTSNQRIRRLTPDLVMVTIAGTGARGFSGDGGPATAAAFNNPRGLAFDAAGNLFVADQDNHRVRRIAPDGVITTFAGAGQPGFSGDGGQATSAALLGPYGVAIDPAGAVLISDTGNHRIRRVAPNGVITTFAGTGQAGSTGDGGPAAQATLFAPTDLALSPDGLLYVTESGGHRLRVIQPDGRIFTAGGIGVRGFSGDGGDPREALLAAPAGIAVSPGRGIYLADTENDRVRLINSAPGSYQLTPAALSFTARSGGALSPSQSILLNSEIAGLPFQATAGTSSGGQWLRASPSGSTMPASVAVHVDPSALSAGTYRGAITIAAPNGSPPMSTVEVTLTVSPAVPAQLAAEPSALRFSFAIGAAAATHQLKVLNTGGGSLRFTASASTSSGGQWLTVAPAGGEATPALHGLLTVTANPGSLPSGTYTGNIRVADTTGAAIGVRITMTVSGVPQTILLSQTGLTFIAVARGGAPPSQNFGVLNIGQGVMPWSASASTISGASGWLRVSPLNGASDAQSLQVPLVDVAIDHSRLDPGEYYGQVEITAPGAVNSPQVASVVLNVLPEGSNPGPIVRPTGLIFTGVAGGSNSSSQDVGISNLTAAPQLYNSVGVTVPRERNFFSHVPVSATVMPNQPLRVVVQPDMQGFAAGIRRGVITLLFDDGSTRNVNLLQVLLNSRPPQAGVRTAASRSAEGCTPTRLLPLLTLLPNNFTLPAAWPNPIEVRIVDDCGEPMTSGTVQAAFSNGDPPVSLISLKDGRWTGTWQARNVQQSQVTVTVNAQVPGTNVRGTVEATGGLRSNPNPPSVASGGIVSAASLASQAPLAPGSIVSIFGTRLADRAEGASSLPLATELASTTVSLAGRSLPLLYASENQINAVVPFDIGINTTQQLVVRKRGSYTLPEPVVVAAAQPAIFTKDQSGKGQGLVFRSDGRLADSATPLAAGDIIVLYCAGLGATNPPVAAGVAAPSSPLATVANPVSLVIGGAEAQVLFAGLAPGFAGLYQVNARVGPGGAASPEAPVVLVVAGQESPPVTVALR